MGDICATMTDRQEWITNSRSHFAANRHPPSFRTATISICKFIGIPWHPFLHSAPPRDRILEILTFFKKENHQNHIASVLVQKKLFIRP